MHTASRREFLHVAVATTAGLALGPSLQAIDPIRRTGKPHIKLSLAAYSYRKYLDLKAKPKPSMTLFDFAELAAGMDLDAIEPTAYYFPETSPIYLARLKGTCTRLGLDISGTAVGNDFCVTDPARLREQIESVKRWVEHASILGAKTIRIFAGTTKKGDTDEKARSRAVEAIQEACDFAGKFGVYLALENHGGVTKTIDEMLMIVKAVKHEWFGVNLDTGNFNSADPYSDLARLAPFAVTVQVKTEMHRAGKPKEEADLARLIGILRAVNYRGYVALEHEAAEDPMTSIPRHISTLKKLIGS